MRALSPGIAVALLLLLPAVPAHHEDPGYEEECALASVGLDLFPHPACEETSPPNQGFEECWRCASGAMPDHWTFEEAWDGSSARWTTEDAMEGRASLRLDCVLSATAVSERVPIQPGQWLEVEGHVRATRGDDDRMFGVGQRFYDAQGGVIWGGMGLQDTTSWTYTWGAAPAPEGAASAAVVVGCSFVGSVPDGNAETGYVDGLRVQVLDEEPVPWD